MLIRGLVVKAAEPMLCFLKGCPLVGAMLGDLHQHNKLINDLHSLSDHGIQQYMLFCGYWYVSHDTLQLAILRTYLSQE